MAMAWYVVHTFSGFENKVKLALEERIKLHGLGPRFGAVMVPTEQVVEVRDGKKRTVQRKFFPGYILVQMEMDNQTLHVVKDTPKVTGFIGDQKPQEVPLAQIESTRRGIAEGAVKPKPRVTFEIGEEVRVLEGPFANFTGIVDEVKPDKQKLKVKVSIFGRPTPVDLDFAAVEKR